MSYCLTPASQRPECSLRPQSPLVTAGSAGSVAVPAKQVQSTPAVGGGEKGLFATLQNERGTPAPPEAAAPRDPAVPVLSDLQTDKSAKATLDVGDPSQYKLTPEFVKVWAAAGTSHSTVLPRIDSARARAASLGTPAVPARLSLSAPARAAEARQEQRDHGHLGERPLLRLCHELGHAPQEAQRAPPPGRRAPRLHHRILWRRG